jgi:hypothetical protein
MDLLDRTERDRLEDVYETNSPFYWTLINTYGDNVPGEVAAKIARQHGTSVEALVAEGGMTLVNVPLTKPMVNALDLVMALGY